MICEYFQETGRAGREGKPAKVILHYNNHGVAKNREGMKQDTWAFGHLETAGLDVSGPGAKTAGHFCFTYC